MAIVTLAGLAHACQGPSDNGPTMEPPSDLVAELNAQATRGLSVLLEVDNADIVPHLQALGFLPRFCFHTYCTGDILPSQVTAVLQVPGVRNMRFLGASHETARQGARHPVWVGVVDEGIYWRDPSFWQPGNRIQWFWDQAKTSNKGDVPYGEEYSGPQLQTLRQQYTTLASDFGHGFPTSIVAAGHLPGHNVVEQPDFPEIPSTTPIILVNTTGRADDILDAVAYIMRRARQANARVVINLSFGGHFGPHDGSDTFTRALDSLVGDDAILIVAAGNDGRRSSYAESRGDPALLRFAVGKCTSQDASFMVEGWYEVAEGAVVDVIDPTNLHSDLVPNGEVSGWRGSEYGAVLDHRLHSSNPRLYGFAVFVQGKCNDLTGTWQVRLQHLSAHSSLDAWVTSTENVRVRLRRKDGDPPGFSAVAGSTHVISVGAYDVNPVNRQMSMNPDTSWGTTRAGARKPDILAPGEVRFFSAGVMDHPTSTGTSIAAALATRCIARLWSSTPSISPQNIRDRLLGIALVVPEELNLRNATGFKAATCTPELIRKGKKP